ncbi:MAG: AAA family ATPase [Kiritimatiellae bacterium]|nr:AAA family ATPase [Kiritimatiellia bacterium]
MNISSGRQTPRGLRAVIYGVEGIGKTTLASKLEKPLFVDFEKGSFGLDVARVEDVPDTWQGMLGMIESLKRDRHGYRTLVIDSADRMEDMIVRDYLHEKGAQSLVGYGKYGDGWIETAERYCTVLDRLGDLADAGMDVVLIGHAQQRRVELPEQTDSYDHWELNLSRRSAPKTREWPEILLFVNYKMSVIPSTRDFGKVVNKAEGGRRMCHAAHTPYYDAKHRAGIEMPDEFPLDEADKVLRAVLGAAQGPGNGERGTTAGTAATAPARDESRDQRTEVKQRTEKAAPKTQPTASGQQQEANAEKPKEQPAPVVAKSATTTAPAKPAPQGRNAALRKALDDFGISDGEIREYIRSKGVCGNNEVWPVDDIPAKFAEWLIARMDAIARKIKENWVPPF